jgi:hypothetical protein
VVLDRGTLSLVSTVEEVLERKSSGSGLEVLEYCLRDPLYLSRDTLHPQKFGTNFADKLLLLGRYSSLAGLGHGVVVSQLNCS